MLAAAISSQGIRSRVPEICGIGSRIHQLTDGTGSGDQLRRDHLPEISQDGGHDPECWQQ